MRWGPDDQYAESAAPAATGTVAVHGASAQSTPIAAAGATDPIADRRRLSGDQAANGLGQSQGIDGLLEHDVGKLLALTGVGPCNDDDRQGQKRRFRAQDTKLSAKVQYSLRF